jgi:uncharacterized RDD family membrane protein YckC
MSDSIPGWYPDPAVAGQQRYWDGTQWTENVAPMPQAAPPPPPPGYAPTPPPFVGYGMPAYGAPTYGMPQTGLAYAHWGLRVGAYLLDSLIFLPFYIAGLIVMGTSTTSTTDVYGNTTSSTSGGGAGIAVILYLLAFALLIWNVYVRQGRTGYSVGKQIVGIKLIKESTGAPLGGWLCFGRHLLHFLDELPFFLGFLWPLWDAKRQTFADKIVSSVVVVAPKPKN